VFAQELRNYSFTGRIDVSSLIGVADSPFSPFLQNVLGDSPSSSNSSTHSTPSGTKLVFHQLDQHILAAAATAILSTPTPQQNGFNSSVELTMSTRTFDTMTNNFFTPSAAIGLFYPAPQTDHALPGSPQEQTNDEDPQPRVIHPVTPSSPKPIGIHVFDLVTPSSPKPIGIHVFDLVTPP
jgi:hypothetical protein